MPTETNVPNLLFLFTDQQRQDTMACYGNELIETPNLNRLSENSVVFDRAYVTQPVCSPSRSSILSGLYPHATGCTRNNIPMRVPALPELLADDNWATAYMGKWHLGDEIFQQHGFDEWVSIEDNYIQYYSPDRDRDARSSYHHFLIDNGFEPANGDRFGRGQAARLPEQFGKPAFLAQQACRFLRDHKDEPFILYINFLEPHSPYFGPRDDQYHPHDVPLPDNFDAPPGPDNHLKVRHQRELWRHRGRRQPLRTGDQWRDLISRYWGLCSLVDTYVGRILDCLGDLQLDDNTIIVYTSDHGDMMGSHQLLTKCSMYEEAAKVPLLMHLPGQQAQKRVTGPVSQIDLAPTLLDLLGQPVPDRLHGKSLRPILEKTGDVHHDEDVFIEWNGPAHYTGLVDGGEVPDWATALASPDELRRADIDPIRTIVSADGWKLNYSPMGMHELFDLNRDPLETANLLNHPEHTDRVHELTQRIAAWQHRVQDPLHLR